ETVLDRAREPRLRREPVVDGHHDTADFTTEQTTELVVGVEITGRPAAAVKPHEHGEIARVGRPVHAQRQMGRRGRDVGILNRVHRMLLDPRSRCHRVHTRAAFRDREFGPGVEPRLRDELQHRLGARIERHVTSSCPVKLAANARNARPRCETACFSAAVISANVRPPPSAGTNTGSYPKPCFPWAEMAIVPSTRPDRITSRPSGQRAMATVSKRAARSDAVLSARSNLATLSA